MGYMSLHGRKTKNMAKNKQLELIKMSVDLVSREDLVKMIPEIRDSLHLHETQMKKLKIEFEKETLNHDVFEECSLLIEHVLDILKKMDNGFLYVTNGATLKEVKEMVVTLIQADELAISSIDEIKYVIKNKVLYLKS